MAVCKNCKIEKQQSDFYKDISRKSGYSYICKMCKNSYVKEYNKKNPQVRKDIYKRHKEKYPFANKERRKKYYKKNKDGKILDYSLRKEYGISLEKYSEIALRQNNVCAICKEPEVRKRRLSVDHCHKTGKVRGLLCDRCNNGIARFDDNVEVLKRAIKYLV